MTPDQATALATASTLRDVEAGMDVTRLYVRAIGRIEAYRHWPDDVLAAATRAVLDTLEAPGGGS